MREPITITATRTIHGYYECAAILNGYRVSQVYGGYTRREALKLFRQLLKREN